MSHNSDNSQVLQHNLARMEDQLKAIRAELARSDTSSTLLSDDDSTLDGTISSSGSSVATTDATANTGLTQALSKMEERPACLQRLSSGSTGWDAASKKPFSETPCAEYGGLSEKAYLDLYFTDYLDVHAIVLEGIIHFNQLYVEQFTGMKAEASAQSQYDLFKAVLEETVKHRKLELPNRHDVAFRFVAQGLAIRDAKTPAQLSGLAMYEMAHNRVASIIWDERKQLAIKWHRYADLFCPMTAAILVQFADALLKHPIKDCDEDCDHDCEGSLLASKWEYNLCLEALEDYVASEHRAAKEDTPLWKKLQSDPEGQRNYIRSILEKNGRD